MENTGDTKNRPETDEGQSVSKGLDLGIAQVLDSLPFYVFLVDEKHRILLANNAIEMVLGIDRTTLSGQYCPKAMHGLDHPFPGCPLEDSVKSGDISEKELFDNYSKRWFRSAVYPIKYTTKNNRKAFLHMSHDITEQKRLEELLRQKEEQIRHVEKLDALARMARGVAHDFNNLLTTIMGCSELALGQIGDNKQLRDDINTVIDASQRASKLTRQLLIFSREQMLELKAVNINTVILNARRMLERLAGHGIELSIDRVEKTPSILANSTQIEQIVLNLVGNACDAMPDGGKLIIKTLGVVVDDDFCRRIPEARTGHFACLSIVDSGTGMDEETLKRLFEPFFTTKREKGTGLGLSTVHGIVKQHKGWINVFSEPGRGSTFKVYLPAV